MLRFGLPKHLPGRALAIGSATAVVLAGSVVMAAPANAAVTIEDDNLVQCIVDALPTGSALNATTIGKITGVLDCADDGITDLTGISLLKGITSLDLSGNPITDLGGATGLGKLTQLLQLDLSGDGLSSIADLSTLTNLLGLDLSDNDLTSLLPLQNLTHLLQLDLSGNGLTSLLGLQNLTGLLDLDLSDNLLESLTNLPALANVLDLDLSGNLLDDVQSVLAKLGDILHISNLDLSDNPISGLLNLGDLQNLLSPVTALDLQPLLTQVGDLLNSVLGHNGLLGGLLSSLGLSLGDLNLGGLLGGIVNNLHLGDAIDLNGLLDGLGLGDTISVFPGDTNITVTTPPVQTNPGTPSKPTISHATTPTITGSAAYGKSLTAVAGSWDATGYAYQWLRDTAPIAGAGAAKYKIRIEDIGHKLTVRVTGTKAGAASVTNSSAPTGKVKAATLLKSPKPKISGTVKVGKKVKAKTTGYNKTVKFKYQWYANGKKISKATKSSYKIAKKYSGKKLVVKITTSKAGYTSLVRSSTSKKVAK